MMDLANGPNHLTGQVLPFMTEAMRREHSKPVTVGLSAVKQAGTVLSSVPPPFFFSSFFLQKVCENSGLIDIFHSTTANRKQRDSFSSP